METLRIHNWDHWQSYRRDRGQPPWIKVHREIMRKVEWVGMADAQRGQLVAIWLLAADRDGVIPASPEIVQKHCFMDSKPDLQFFIDQGFIEPDAKAASERRQDDANMTNQSRDRDRIEKEKPLGASADTPKEKSSKKEYTPEFEELWKTRPKRQGPDSKWDAFKAYRARIREGHTHEQMAQAVGRYRGWLKAQGKIGTEFVKMLSTFLGPAEHFLEDWTNVPDTQNGAGRPHQMTEEEYYLRGAQ